MVENDAVPAELTLYRRPVGTVFDLLGDKENDITYSVGWALAQSDRFAVALLRDVFCKNAPRAADKVMLQEGISGAGFTDIEILAGEGSIHLIIEARRGYSLPSCEQLTRYAERSKPRPTAMLVTAEAPSEFATGSCQRPSPTSRSSIEAGATSSGSCTRPPADAAAGTPRRVSFANSGTTCEA